LAFCLIRKKDIDLFQNIEGSCVTETLRETLPLKGIHMEFCTAYNKLKDMEDDGIVEVVRENRPYVVKYTEKGKRIAGLLQQLQKELRE
jgi:predicted transcriptional regulator